MNIKYKMFKGIYESDLDNISYEVFKNHELKDDVFGKRKQYHNYLFQNANIIRRLVCEDDVILDTRLKDYLLGLMHGIQNYKIKNRYNKMVLEIEIEKLKEKCDASNIK